MSQNNIPVSETYWSLVEKADKKFSKIRDLPYYERNRSFFLSSYFFPHIFVCLFSGKIHSGYKEKWVFYNCDGGSVSVSYVLLSENLCKIGMAITHYLIPEKNHKRKSKKRECFNPITRAA